MVPDRESDGSLRITRGVVGGRSGLQRAAAGDDGCHVFGARRQAVRHRRAILYRQRSDDRARGCSDVCHIGAYALARDYLYSEVGQRHVLKEEVFLLSTKCSRAFSRYCRSIDKTADLLEAQDKKKQGQP